jgi:hypothetical protein
MGYRYVWIFSQATRFQVSVPDPRICTSTKGCAVWTKCNSPPVHKFPHETQIMSHRQEILLQGVIPPKTWLFVKSVFDESFDRTGVLCRTSTLSQNNSGMCLIQSEKILFSSQGTCHWVPTDDYNLWTHGLARLAPTVSVHIMSHTDPGQKSKSLKTLTNEISCILTHESVCVIVVRSHQTS